jgi:hypothetical protein
MLIPVALRSIPNRIRLSALSDLSNSAILIHSLLLQGVHATLERPVGCYRTGIWNFRHSLHD